MTFRTFCQVVNGIYNAISRYIPSNNTNLASLGFLSFDFNVCVNLFYYVKLDLIHMDVKFILTLPGFAHIFPYRYIVSNNIAGTTCSCVFVSQSR